MSDLTRFRDHARRQATAGHGDPGDAALWGQLADEVDAYLEGKAGPVVDLFGHPAVEPEPDPEVPC